MEHCSCTAIGCACVYVSILKSTHRSDGSDQHQEEWRFLSVLILGYLLCLRTLDKKGKEMTAGNNKKKNSIRGQRTKKEKKNKRFHFLWNFTHPEALVDPQVLRSESAGTEYHSAVLMTGGIWPSAKRPHTGPLAYTLFTTSAVFAPPPLCSAGALDHCSCCPTLFRLGKISTINLQAVSHADPSDPRQILQ